MLEGDNMKSGSRRTILALFGIAMVCFWGATISNGQRGEAPKPQMSEDAFKNVQVLKGIPVDEFMDTMGMISAALGLNCLDCHTSDSDTAWERFAADTAMKRTSRRMIQMVGAINKENFGGARGVTCWTCHRGDLRPSTLPNLTIQYSAPLEDPNDVQIRPDSSAPSADAVFDKYFQALGGVQQLNNLTSFTAKGTYKGFDTHHTTVPVELLAKAPNQRTLIIHAAFADRTWAYNGREAWVAAIEKPLPLLPMTGGNLEGQKIEAMMCFPTQIKQAFSQWRVGRTSIDDKDVTVLQGTNPRQPPLNLYFDDSGMLVRMVRFVETPIGRVPTQIDYSDYRPVGSVKMPFNWNLTWTDGQVTIEFTEVQPNVAIDASKFERPAPAQLRK
jgi:photosynthetic reaction center cytochrome c subunit